MERFLESTSSHLLVMGGIPSSSGRPTFAPVLEPSGYSNDGSTYVVGTHFDATIEGFT